MKPKDLKPPFPRLEKKILIQDRVWFIPESAQNEEDFQFPGWENAQIFGNSQSIFAEYCSGNGAWIVEKALNHPDVNWLAIEIKFDRVRKIWSKMKNAGLQNLFILCGEGEQATARYFPSLSIERAFINFPDPWPKRRHAKHRIANPSFIAEMHRILKPGGEITLVTDDPDYSGQMTRVLSSQTGLQAIHPDPYYCTHIEGYGTSFFDNLWRESGKIIRYHQYKKRA